ncbi:MAG: PEP-CTERM sorting domain-containing protein [Terrimicrobiaceae bacterium]
MKKTILALALVAGLTSFAGNAKADLIFNFNMIDDQDPSKSVILNLFLNEAGTAATSASITGSTGGIHFDANRNFVSDAYSNSFSLVSGNITSALFSSSIYNYTSEGSVLNMHSLSFQSYSSESWFGVTLPNFRYTDSVYDYRVNGGSFTQDDSIFATVGIPGQSAVPEPSTYVLFGLGALAMIVAYRRKVA